MTNDYSPIACALWDEWELAILKKTEMAIAYLNDAGQKESVHAVPVDLITRDKAEFLIIELDGDRKEIRLDQLR